MSSTYSSYNGAPRCQRCGAPRTHKELRCTHCGYTHEVLPESSSPQRQQPLPAMPWKQPIQPVQHEPIVTQNTPGQRQPGGLLKRFPQSGQLMNNGGYRENVAQSASAPPFAHGPTKQPFHASFEQMEPPAYAQVPNSFYEKPRKQRRSNMGRIVGIVILLLLVVGGSLLAYTFLFTHKNIQQARSSTASHVPTPTSVPLGNPLFQDEFTNNANGWSIQSYPGEFSVALGNGALKLENDNHKLLWELVPGGKNYGDFQLSVDAVLAKGSQDNGYGVYIRSALSQNASITTFYRFELYGDGSFAIFKGTIDANGTVTTPRLVDYTNNSAIQKQGSLNHLTIDAKGSSLQFIVNGQTVSTMSDATYTSGSIALFVSNLQKAPPGAEATFSHLVIYPAQK